MKVSDEFLFTRKGAAWDWVSISSLPEMEKVAQSDAIRLEKARSEAAAEVSASRQALTRMAFASEAHPWYLALYALASLMIATFLWLALPRVSSNAWSHRGGNGIGDLPAQFGSNKIADGTARAVHNMAASVSPSAALGLIGVGLGAVGVVVGGYVVPDALGLFYPTDTTCRALLAAAALIWALAGMRCLAVVMRALPLLIGLGVLIWLAGAIFKSFTS
ncbi:MAG: hypothetical protein WA159_16070 [Variovorax sp.]